MDRELFRTVKQAVRNHARVLYHRLVCRLPHLLAVTLLLVVLPPLLSTLSLATLWAEARANAPLLVAACSGCLAAAYAYAVSRPRPVYLVDLAGYKPGPAHESTRAHAIRQFGLAGGFDDESMAFQKRMMERSGLGEATHFPASLMSNPVVMSLRTAREESEAVVFGVVDELLAKTGVRAQDVGIVIANSSLYAPTPSFVSLIVNKYRLREDVVSHNLSGMGCSAGIIAIDLAKHLLQVYSIHTAISTHADLITFLIDLMPCNCTTRAPPPETCMGMLTSGAATHASTAWPSFVYGSKTEY
jgi:3-ketoacyl-CoA synthase